MRWSTTLIACLLVPMHAAADTWAGMASKVSGVELTSLSAGENGHYVGLLDGESKEFLSHCTKGGLVYVSGALAPVKCQLGDPDIRGEFFQILLTTKESLKLSEPLVISKKPIPPRLNLFEFSSEELEMLKIADRRSLELEKNAFICYQRRYKEIDENSAKIDRQLGRPVTQRTTTYKQDHDKYVRDIKSSAQYKKFHGKKFKIPSPNGFLYISSIGLDSCDSMGWNIVNVVYAKVGDSLVETARFDGCIKGGFRDLNGDGTPEVLTQTCENGESTNNSYWTVFPAANVLLAQ
jgi:hypothetical protein